MSRILWGKTIFITGATGLIGQALVKEALAKKMKVIASVRNIDKAKKLFEAESGIEFLESDIMGISLENRKVDYLIHAAANTSSTAFVNDPVGIINENYQGTLRTLEFARFNNVKKYVYLSSMEIYGHPHTDEKVTETHATNLDMMSVRSSYPESKRACEILCCSYMSQYNVPINAVRLTQTIGAGVKYDDNRVFAQFARSVIEGKDIILHTKGETKRSYLYLDDAVSAIYTVLEKGADGEAYNAANEETYCSIYEMANLVANECADGRINVLIEENESNHHGYAPTLKMNLSTEKLRNLGWEPHVGLKEMFDILIQYMSAVRKE